MDERDKAIRLAKAYFGVPAEGRSFDWPEGYRGGLLHLKVKNQLWKGVWNPYLNIEHAKMLQEVLRLVGWTIAITATEVGFVISERGFGKWVEAQAETVGISELALGIAEEGWLPRISDDILAEMLHELKTRL